MKKENCWEFIQCGKEVGGKNLNGGPPCPASLELRLHGSNDGFNGGRACWVVENTHTTSDFGGVFTNKLAVCKQCEFYQLVHEEQGERIIPLIDLFDKIMDLDIDPVIEDRKSRQPTSTQKES